MIGTLGLNSCGGGGEPETAPTSSASPSEPAVSESTSDAPSPSASASDPVDVAPEPAQPDAIACDSLWSAGTSIPRFYPGCNDGDVFVPRDSLGCSSGQRLVRFGDRFYGVLGGTVTKAESSLDSDKGYRGSVARCRA